MRTRIMSIMLVLFITVVLGLAGCGGGGSVSGENVPNNKVTAANAGSSQNVSVSSQVILDGSQSTGADGKLITYSWSITSKPAGSAATLSSSTIVNPTFLADVAGVYVVSLVVNDGTVNSEPSTVTITASQTNSAPVANAGTGANVMTGRLLTLDGSASSDADGNTLSYAWSFTSKPAGSNAVLSNTTSIHPTFTPDIDGSYVINLVVNDGKIDSAPSVVTIKSVTDPSLLFSMIIASTATSTAGFVQPGSSFSSNIKNISNETFTLSKYTITNGGILVSSTTDPSLLNNNRLAPGENVSVKYTISTLPIQDLGFAANYYLTDPVTKTDFVVNKLYPTIVTGTYQY